MKIEEGMYCYNKINRKSGIGKIVGFRENNNAIIKYVSDIAILSIGNIVASYNIIDLVEVGDYVNGQLVYYDEESECLGQNFVDADSNYYFESITKGGDYKIKTILTKEQYENNCYKVEE